MRGSFSRPSQAFSASSIVWGGGGVGGNFPLPSHSATPVLRPSGATWLSPPLPAPAPRASLRLVAPQSPPDIALPPCSKPYSGLPIKPPPSFPAIRAPINSLTNAIKHLIHLVEGRGVLLPARKAPLNEGEWKGVSCIRFGKPCVLQHSTSGRRASAGSERWSQLCGNCRGLELPWTTE